MHWSHDEIMQLDHKARKKWCDEISKINAKINGEKSEKSLAEML
jgi:hypothetical protein